MDKPISRILAARDEPANPSRTEDDTTRAIKADDPHAFALSIFSRILFLIRSATLVISVQKNKRVMVTIIGIAISQNLR